MHFSLRNETILILPLISTLKAAVVCFIGKSTLRVISFAIQETDSGQV